MSKQIKMSKEQCAECQMLLDDIRTKHSWVKDCPSDSSRKSFKKSFKKYLAYMEQFKDVKTTKNPS